MSSNGEDELPGEEAAVERAFGATNRRKILTDYFDASEEVTPNNAWQHVYALLLWINPTISLAHCYESDKCQPHKPWYPRSLAFHAWIAERFGVSPIELRDHIDYLFRGAFPTLARVEVDVRRAAAVRHLSGLDITMPLPNDDPMLAGMVFETLGLDSRALLADHERTRELVERIYTYFERENKRKNLLGRGFEDTLAAVIEHLPGHERWEIGTRVRLGDIPGFAPQGDLDKRTEIDLALWESSGTGRRLLVTAKWSVRSDRERQFDSDFDDYSKANIGGVFDYVLVTNEFDAARLDAACTKVRGNRHLFTDVVHVQPEGVLVAYGIEIDGPRGKASARNKSSTLAGHINASRLIPLSEWLNSLLR